MAILAVLIPYETDTVGDPGAVGVVVVPVGVVVVPVGVVVVPGGGTTEYVYCAMVPGAVAVEALPVSVMTPPGPTVEGVAVKTATGMPWIVTVAVTGALCCPKLSVTTSWNVTVPEVFGTVTGCTGLGVVIGWPGTMATAPAAADAAAAGADAAAAGADAAAVAASGAAVLASVVAVSLGAAMVAAAGVASGAAAVVAALGAAGVVGGVGVVATMISFALVLGQSVLLQQGPLIRGDVGPGWSG
jgi:hypothetical protein